MQMKRGESLFGEGTVETILWIIFILIAIGVVGWIVRGLIS